MANYKVDIGVKVKGEELKKFGEQLKDTQKQVNGVNRFLDTFRKQNIRVNESISNLNGQLRLAKTTLNDATIGTKQAVQATRDYLTALTNTNAALAAQKAAVVSLQNARRSDAFFLAQGARAGRQNRLDETQSQAISTAIARENNIRIQAELANQELLKEVQTRAPRLPAFQDRGLERLEDEFKKKKELKILEENANKASQRRLNFQEKQNAELNRQKELGIGINKNEKLINASFEDRVKFAEKSGKIRRQALTRANNLESFEKRIAEEKELSAALEKMEKRSAANLKDQVKLRKQSRKIGQDNVKLKIKEAQATRKVAENEALASRTAARRRIGSTASSAIIGGAFPLLFGQTGAAAVGGGLGGLAGGAIGGQFGFALSILGTALGSAVDKNQKFRESLAALNVQFSTTSGGTQILSSDIDQLAKRLSITKEEAFSILGAFSQFGSGRIAKSLATIFGSDSGSFESIAGANRQAQLAKEIFEARKQIGIQRATELQQMNLTNKAAVVELALAEAKAKVQNDIAVAKEKEIRFSDILRAGENPLTGQMGKPGKFGEERARKLQEKFDNEKLQRQEAFTEALEKFRNLLGLTNEAQGQFGQSGVLAFSAITDKVKDLQDEMKRLQNPISQVILLSESIARSFEDSFVGIIKGTMSVGDAFRNMLNVIADEFIRNAARMAANQFQQGILGFFSNIFSPVKPIPKQSSTGPLGNFDFGMAADGGRIPGGRPTLVGERGPELFTPGVSGMITPNEMLGGGSTNIVVNVDASGSSVEGDEQGGRELGRVISAAVQSELIQQKRPGGLLA